MSYSSQTISANFEMNALSYIWVVWIDIDTRDDDVMDCMLITPSRLPDILSSWSNLCQWYIAAVRWWVNKSFYNAKKNISFLSPTGNCSLLVHASVCLRRGPSQSIFLQLLNLAKEWLTDVQWAQTHSVTVPLSSSQ